MKRWGSILSTMLLLSAPIAALAAEPAEVRVVQSVVKLPQVITYVNVLDGAGAPIQDLASPQVIATLAGNPLDIKAIEPVRRDDPIAYVFLVDVSKSLKPAQFDALREVLRSWLTDLGPNDRATILTFGSSVEKLTDFTGDLAVLRSKLADLAPADGSTMLYQALKRGLDTARRVDQGLPGRRAVVLLSDGMDDEVGSATREEVLADLKRDPIPIYAVVYDGGVAKKREKALKDIGMVVRSSGGSIVLPSRQDLETGAVMARRAIHGGIRLTGECPSCVADNSTGHLDLVLGVGKHRLSAVGIDVRMIAAPASPKAAQEVIPAKVQPEPQWYENWVIWAVVGGVFVLAGGGLTWWLMSRRSQAAPAPGPIPAANQALPVSMVVNTGRQTPSLNLGATIPVGPGMAPAPQVPPLRLGLIPVGRSEMPPAQVDLIDRVVIGRAAGSGVRVPDATASGTHCALIRAGERVQIEDLESNNGTWVNGVRVQGRQNLSVGDVITVGKTELRFRMG